jgi:SAM-dependent methyltransferase
MASGTASPWSAHSVVDGFSRSPPNEVLLRYAAERRRSRGPAAGVPFALDLGCGAGRNAVPLANLGFDVLGVDSSLPMLLGARERTPEPGAGRHLRLALAGMDRLPVGDRRCNLVVAHGVWNLARSAAEFRRAVGEAARVAAPGAGLFVFTFSRATLPESAEPVAGEKFVFTQFSGEPQCFLTATELFAELAAAGFSPDPAVPLTEYNRPAPGARRVPGARGAPAIYEAAFHFGS